MTETTASGIDDDQEWTERPAWAYGLIATDPAERAVALVRLARAQTEVESARRRIIRAWLPTPRLRFKTWDRRTAQKAYDEAASRCLPEALSSRWVTGEISTWAGLPFALLFMEWKARYPQEWTRHAKAWGMKQWLISKPATADHEDQVRTRLIELVDLAVQRVYRCKDRAYVRVARAVDGDELRARLLANPEVPRHVWTTWLAGTQVR
ncbi:hypothetical protein [Streptomyces sp. AGS-58]|uniref:hypothetical protein n=1 Tax=unclassified Streptomyces TaxID=2593676 RepID=UPI0035A350DD